MEHHIDATPDRVAAAMVEPEFEERLAKLPNVGERVVNELTREPDGSMHRVVHYKFGGNLPTAVVKAIGGDTITWDEIGDYDPRRREWRFRIVPKVFRGGFDAHGSYAFAPEGDGTKRIVEIDMRVKVPVVGRLVERAIRDGLVETLDAEARLLQEYLA